MFGKLGFLDIKIRIYLSPTGIWCWFFALAVSSFLGLFYTPRSMNAMF